MALRAIPRAPARIGSRQTAPPPASVVLGPDHPIARAVAARHTIGCQTAVTALVVATSLIDVLEGGGRAAITLLSSALVVELGLICALAFTRVRVREGSRDFIADVDHPAAIAEVAAERALLGSGKRREQIACSLERALHAAEHWSELSITSRPPPTVRHLLGCAASARDVARLARDPATPVRGIALLDRLVCGGYSSVLYAGSADSLARELGRIRFLLAAGEGDGV